MIFGQGINIKIYDNSIFTEAPHKEIVRLLSDKEGKLKDKRVALFVVCLRKEYIKVGEREGGGPVYIRKMEDDRERSPVASKIFGGRLSGSVPYQRRMPSKRGAVKPNRGHRF